MNSCSYREIWRCWPFRPVVQSLHNVPASVSWPQSTLSTYVSGYTYIFNDGFRFPFGDYFDLTIDYLDHTQACWGEGYNWLTPGSVWYTSQLS
jgi:hypothetical protein